MTSQVYTGADLANPPRNMGRGSLTPPLLAISQPGGLVLWCSMMVMISFCQKIYCNVLTRFRARLELVSIQ